MAQPLDYAQRSSRRRNRVLFVITILAIAVSLFLARPKIKAFQDRQNRRAAIRKQFDAQLQIAEKAINENALDRAGHALFDAEFPVRTEAKLFWSSEIDSFDERIKPLRHRLDQLGIIVDQKRNAPPQVEPGPQTNAAYEGNFIIACRVCRSKTLSALESKAAQQLNAGNTGVVLGICRQIIDLDPTHHFDKTFWSNAR